MSLEGDTIDERGSLSGGAKARIPRLDLTSATPECDDKADQKESVMGTAGGNTVAIRDGTVCVSVCSS